MKNKIKQILKKEITGKQLKKIIISFYGFIAFLFVCLCVIVYRLFSEQLTADSFIGMAGIAFDIFIGGGLAILVAFLSADINEEKCSDHKTHE